MKLAEPPADIGGQFSVRSDLVGVVPQRVAKLEGNPVFLTPCCFLYPRLPSK